MYIYVTLYIYCSLHMDPTWLKTSIKYQCTATFIYHTIAKYVPAINMPTGCQKMWHMPMLLNQYSWRKYANIQATCKVAPINDVARIVVHRWLHIMTMMAMLMLQRDNINWVGHLAKLVKKHHAWLWIEEYFDIVWIIDVLCIKHRCIHVKMKFRAPVFQELLV